MSRKLVSEMTDAEKDAYRTRLREYAAGYRERNREKMRAQARERRQNNLAATREYDAQWKRKARANDSEYAQKVKERKRSKEYRVKVNEARTSPQQRAKSRQYRATYSARPYNKIKEAARTAVNSAIQKGILTRPDTCSRCNSNPGKGRDGRSLIRADHYMGYAPEYHLVIQWICSRCDGEIERQRAQTKTSVQTATNEARD